MVGGDVLQPNLNWADIVALTTLFVCALQGFANGFILSAFNILGLFIAIYSAKLISPQMLEYICSNTTIDEAINNYFLNKPYINLPVIQILNLSGVSPNNITNILSSSLILILSFMFIFISSMVIFRMIANIFNIAARLPVLSQFNRLGGIIFGVLKGLALLYILSALLTLIVPLLSPANKVIQAINNSAFAVYFYKYNLLILWLSQKVQLPGIL